MSTPIIKTSDELFDHYDEISDYCHTHAEPVFITRDGRIDLVIMSLEYYQLLSGKLADGKRMDGKPGGYTYEDYLLLPDDIRVELIDGVLYDMPTPCIVHQAIQLAIYEQFGPWLREHPGRRHCSGSRSGNAFSSLQLLNQM